MLQQNSTTKQLYSTIPETHASLQVKKAQTLTKGKAIDMKQAHSHLTIPMQRQHGLPVHWEATPTECRCTNLFVLP